MIIFKKFDKTIEICNDHWKKLRTRYSPENAVYIKSREVYKIRKKCPFCDLYNTTHGDECNGCPFRAFGLHGCYEFFEQVFSSGQAFESDVIAEITWDKGDDKEARKQLTKLQKMMDKIEASQNE